MIVSDQGIFSLSSDGAMRGVLAHAVACDCGRMAQFVVNRLGKTRCVDCDQQLVERLKAGQAADPTK